MSTGGFASVVKEVVEKGDGAGAFVVANGDGAGAALVVANGDGAGAALVVGCSCFGANNCGLGCGGAGSSAFSSGLIANHFDESSANIAFSFPCQRNVEKEIKFDNV